MEWLVTLSVLIGFATGLLVGRYISKRTYQTKVIGTLLIETSDPNNANMFFTLNEPIDELCQRQFAFVSVKHGSYISQE